jgi:hypothetical protein
MAIARGALEAEGENEVLSWLDSQPAKESQSLAARLDVYVQHLEESWQAVDARWWPRCESPAAVILGGQRVICSVSCDVVLGGRPTPWPKLLIEVKVGGSRPDTRYDLHWYALLAALSHGEAPGLVIAWSAADGVAIPEPVHEGTLRSALARGSEALARLGELASGRPPTITPGPACNFCPVQGDCEEGRAWLEDKGNREASARWSEHEGEESDDVF